MLLYLVTHRESGKEYVGVTKRGLAVRRYQHEYAATKPNPNCRRLANALRKHGPAAFDWEVLRDGLEEREALALERLVIQQRGTLSPAGYNLVAGGRGTLTPSEETISKRKLSLAKYWSTPGVREYRGRCVARVRGTQESRAKTSARLKERALESSARMSAWLERAYQDPSYREKNRLHLEAARVQYWREPANHLAASERNKQQMTTEARKKVTAGVQASWDDPERRAARLAAMELVKEKRGAAIRAQKSSPEGREANRRAALARWAKRRLTT